METAVRHGSKRCVYPPLCTEDVLCEITMTKEAVCVGKDAVLSIALKNKCSSARTVTLNSQVSAMYYTGVCKGLVKKDQTCFELKACECKSYGNLRPHILVKVAQKSFNIYLILAKVLEWTVRYEDYKCHLVEHASMLLTVAGRVTQTKQIVAKRFNFRLCSPDLVISVSARHLLVFGMETDRISARQYYKWLSFVLFSLDVIVWWAKRCPSKSRSRTHCPVC